MNDAAETVILDLSDDLVFILKFNFLPNCKINVFYKNLFTAGAKG